MNEHEREQAFLAQARRVLDASAAELDPATRTRLKAARAAALAARGPRLSWWLPIGGLATAAGAALLAWTLLLSPVQPAPGLEHLDLLTAADNLEFYSDLEFYTWLAEEADAG
ncbi:MAG TPA: hypothetical protein VGA00_11460 [Acidiferrobacterales bacterium]|jgi:hypothetical protein